MDEALGGFTDLLTGGDDQIGGILFGNPTATAGVMDKLLEHTSDGVLSDAELDLIIEDAEELGFSNSDAMALVNHTDSLLVNMSDPAFRAAAISNAMTLGDPIKKIEDAGYSRPDFFFSEVLEEHGDFVGTHVENSPSFDGKVFYKLTSLETGLIVRSGKPVSPQSITLRVQPEAWYLLELVDPENLLYGANVTRSPANGVTKGLPIIPLSDMGTDLEDRDADGLPDLLEDVIGTSPTSADTDGDNIDDLAELQQGTNPLDGLIVQSGVIASAPVTGSATDVCALNNIAATANGPDGVSIFNIFSGLNPLRIAEFDTEGTALSVACFGDYVAVADYTGGLVVFDVRDPANVTQVYQVRFGSYATAVTAAGPIAFVGLESGRIAKVDIPTGAVLETFDSSVGSVQDLLVVSDHLFAVSQTAVSMIGDPVRAPTLLDTLVAGQSRAFRRRLFGAGNLLYLSGGRDIEVIERTEAGQLESVGMISSSQGTNTRHFVRTGSGQGLGASDTTRAQIDNVDLYGMSADAKDAVFAFNLATPGQARALSVYNGLAYVADGSSGLQVVNYLAYDNAGNPPTITLFADQDVSSGTVEEGSVLPLRAEVQDDVQVRNVEFYIDGQLAITDGNFPFSHRYLTPTIASGATSVKLRAKATDTGGNSTWSNDIEFALGPDVTPPRVLEVFPENGRVIGQVDFLRVRFSELIAPVSLSGGFSLISAGVDGALNTGDDINAPLLVEFRDESLHAYLSATQPLVPDRYQLAVNTTIRDLAGNALQSPEVSTFTLASGADRDGDGLPDDWELVIGTDPDDPDSDGNGTPDGLEDADGDGLPNVGEVLLGRDLLVKDSDGNGINDGLEDLDGDRLVDGDEIRYGTNPEAVDSDGDGWDDNGEIAEGMNPLIADSPVQNFVSRRASILNALEVPLPNDVAISASTVAGSYLNAVPFDLPSVLNTAASSASASYLNSVPAALPDDLPTSASSRAASYLNAAPPPEGPQPTAVSPGVSYENKTQP